MFGLGNGIRWGLETLKTSPTAKLAVEGPAPGACVSSFGADTAGPTAPIKPSGTDKDIAYAILGALPSNATPEKTEAAAALLGYAVQWDMIELWKNTLAKCTSGMFTIDSLDASAKGKGRQGETHDIWAKRIIEGLAMFGFGPLLKRYGP